MLETVLRRARSTVRKAAARGIGVPLDEHPTAAQDDRPSPRLLREIAALRLTNLRSRAPAIDPSGECVVTMTTHGDRIRLVWVALESIARGERRPRRLVLFIDEPELAGRLPGPLRRLQRRGLEILPARPELRVHAKYWPHVASTDRHELPLVVSDDDMVYPRRWLRTLQDAHRARPDLVHAFRAHEMPCVDGRLGPYRTWQPVRGTHASLAHFGTGVSGQLLPVPLLDRLVQEGEAFLERSPSADDIWINAVAVRAGIRTAQVEEESRNFPFVPATQATGLYRTNVAGGQNDAQLERALRPEDVARICADRGATPARADAPLLVAWGRFTDNPWQDIVERAARGAGFDALDLEHGAPLEGILERATRGGLAVHLNWTAPITQRADNEEGALATVDAVLEQVDLLRRAGGALVWTVHNVLPHEARHHAAEVRLLQGLAARADVVHVMHPSTADAVADVWQLPLERQVLVEHPSYLGIYPDAVSRDQARAALGVPADRTVVLLHGLLREYKGVRAMVEGFLAAREVRDDLHVLIAGRPGEGFDEAELEPLRDRADATLHVGYVPVDEVQRWHRAADALVMPYRAGLNSGALQLAATFDLPVIAFPCLAVEAAVAEGWAVVVDPASPRWLLDGLASLPADAPERSTAAAVRRSPERVGAEMAALATTALERRRATGERPSLRLVAVVVSFGSAELIERGLGDALRGLPAVIVENPTTPEEHDRLVAVADRLGARLRVMASDVGFGAAVGAGVAEAAAMGAERVLLLNPDLELERAAIDRLLTTSQLHPRAIVAPRIVTSEGALWFDGGVLDWRAGVARHRAPDEAARPLEWLTGACLLLPIDVWQGLEGFDEDFFLSWEDVELTHRWSRLGELVLDRDATVVHRVGGTQGEGDKSLGYSYYNARNRLLFAASHVGLRTMLAWIRSSGAYAEELVARSGAADPATAARHRAAAMRGARNGALRALARRAGVRRRPAD